MGGFQAGDAVVYSLPGSTKYVGRITAVGPDGSYSFQAKGFKNTLNGRWQHSRTGLPPYHVDPIPHVSAAHLARATPAEATEVSGYEAAEEQMKAEVR